MLYMRRDVVAVRITVTNTFKGLLGWIKDKTGVGDINSGGMATAIHKERWDWRCNAEPAETLLRQVRPWLLIKAIQADLAIETQERLRNPALKADRTWQAEYRQRMQALNKRGPAEDG